MKRMLPIVSLFLVVSILATGFACAKPAPAPSPTAAPPASKPAASPAPAPAPKPAPKASPLAAIIEGAKKEGTVTAFLSSMFNPAEVTLALEKAVKAKYGVDLKIKPGGARGMGQQMATAILENKTGRTPEFDLMGFSTGYVPEGTKAGVFEIVDWRPLVEPGTPREMVPQEAEVRGSLIYLNTADGLMYNPDKIPAAEVPRKLADLLNPKWQGRLGIMSYPLYWVHWGFVLGKDKVFSWARSLVKTKPRIDEFSKLNNLYLLGEIDLAFTNAGYIELNRAKGKPTAFRNLDLIAVRDTHLLVTKGAKHSNAAKLLALFLVSPEGVKFTKDQSGRSLVYFPGNLMYDTYQQGIKEGLKAFNEYSYPGMMDFINSPDNEKWQKEVTLILRGD